MILLWKRSDMKLGEQWPRGKKLKKIRKRNKKEFGGLEGVNKLLKKMPENMMFIMRASNLVGLHNLVLGGNNRGRLIEFGRVCIETLYGTEFNIDEEFKAAEDELLHAALSDV
jgi:hypothetical protein